MLVKQFHYISKEDSIKIIDNISNIKHKLMVLLMLDCGLRVSETVTIKFKNLDFKNKTLTIQSLKKKGKKKLRTIPISNRLYRSIADYLSENKKIKLNRDSYLFPSYSSKGYIDRKTVWKVLNTYSKKLNIPNLHPHTLRHSFATHHLSEGTSLAEIKEMLGHESYNTTLIYAEIPTEKLKERVNTVTAEHTTLWQKIGRFLIPEKKPKIINLDFSESYFTIGRNDELSTLQNNANKGINTIIIGNIGVGKSHLLENIKTDKKILRLDDTESIKKSLIQMLLFLYKDKNKVTELLWKDFTLDQIKNKIQRENTLHLCDTIISSITPKEYILIIDDITRITPTGKKVIERLSNVFTIITAARNIRANQTSFIWDFEILKLKELNRNYSIQLIQQLSNGLEVENYELFRNHIFEQTNGNPRAITELINRYRKEPFVTNEVVREIKHVGALPEFDMTFIIVLFLGVITCMRYMAKELDEPSLKFIGSIGLIILLICRPLFKKLTRKFI